MVTVRRAFTALSVLVLSGCPEVPSKPVVTLPPIEGSLRAEVVAHIGDLGDVRSLAVDGETLYVAHDDGLSIFDVTIPEEPELKRTVAIGKTDAVAVADGRAYTIDISGSHTLRVIDVSVAEDSREIANTDAVSLIFGGLAVRDGLLWHAVGSNPPSSIYFDLENLESCEGPIRERGAMNIWLSSKYAFESTHFDDFAGDGFAGNGAYGLAILDVGRRDRRCPDTRLTDIVFFDTHARNRSTYERSSNSDLQAAFHEGTEQLFLTGEQRVRSLALDGMGRATESSQIDIPEVLDVAAADTASGPVLGLANGDFQLVDARGPRLLYSGAVSTEGVARVVEASSDGTHFFVGDSEHGVLVLRYEETP